MAWYAVPRRLPELVPERQVGKRQCKAYRGVPSRGGQAGGVAGTCLQYDWRFGFCSENVTPIRPTTLYGICKNSLQEIVNHLPRDEDFSTAWGRIFFLYGPYEPRSRLVPSVILSLLGGQTARCTHGRQIRDFMHVRDVAEAFVAVLDSDVRGTVNIASGTPVTIKELIYLVADALGERGRVELGALEAPRDEPALLVADICKITRGSRVAPKADASRWHSGDHRLVEGCALRLNPRYWHTERNRR